MVELGGSAQNFHGTDRIPNEYLDFAFLSKSATSNGLGLMARALELHFLTPGCLLSRKQLRDSAGADHVYPA